MQATGVVRGLKEARGRKALSLVANEGVSFNKCFYNVYLLLEQCFREIQLLNKENSRGKTPTNSVTR